MSSAESPAIQHPATAADAGQAAVPVTFPVSLADGQQARWQVTGHLFLPAPGQAAAVQPATIQVLVPGFTYDHRYWTVPGRYDYTRFMLSAGYAVLALDRIGTGASSRPPATDVTTDSNAFTLHQVIQALRAGLDGYRPFSKVILAGHSYGAGVAIVEAARYHDSDGLIVSGMLHATAPLHDEARSFFHHAGQDPVLGQTGTQWPEFYMTQRPGLRQRLLEYAPDIDEEMSRYNEAIKSTATLGEGDSLPQTYDPAYSRALRMPVLVVMGEKDALFASEAVAFAANDEAVGEFEKDFYPPDAPPEVRVIAGAGHSLNIHRSSTPAWFEIVAEWAGRRVGG